MSKILLSSFVILLMITHFQIKCEEEEKSNTTLNETEMQYDQDDDFETPNFFEEDENIDSIVQLSKANISSYLKQEKEVYLFFYSPWSKYCRSYKPELLKAADIIKKENKYNLKFAFVNGALNDELVKEYDIDSFPSLLLFLNDKRYNYTSRRKHKDVLKYYERMKNGEVISVRKIEEVEKLQKNNPFLLISTIKDQNNSKLYESFKAYATKNMKYDFVDCSSDECIKKYGANDILLFKTFDEKINSYNKDFLPLISKDNITQTFNLVKQFFSVFGVEAGVELVEEEDIFPLFENNKKGFFYFRDSSNKAQTSKDIVFKEFGLKLRNKNIYTIVADIKGDDDSVAIQFANSFLIGSSKLPVIFFYNVPLEGKEDEVLRTFRKTNVNENEITLDYLFKFYSDIKEGKVLRDLKSEPIPQEKEENGVKVIVGQNYDDEVIKEKRNVAIVFVGMNIEVSQMYLEFFEILAKKYKDKDDIVFAFMDATRNEPRDVVFEDTDMFPLVYLSIPNDNKERKKIKFKPEDIESVRENDIEKFIADNLGWKIEEVKKNEEKKEENKKNEKNNGNEDL